MVITKLWEMTGRETGRSFLYLRKSWAPEPARLENGPCARLDGQACFQVFHSPIMSNTGSACKYMLDMSVLRSLKIVPIFECLQALEQRFPDMSVSACHLEAPRRHVSCLVQIRADRSRSNSGGDAA